ncbi:MAG: DUF1329 domain-containing protein [Deltaproteobacteria bacterium]|nr:DUF1329 domain-containing protein [Deltaproteobacteria bacterium]
MNPFKPLKHLLALFLTISLLPLSGWAEEKLPHPETYIPSCERKLVKAVFDDPTDLFAKKPFKDFVPPEIYGRLTFDQEKMKKEWAELIGFTALELVGKIAPEIKPGKYSYTDLEKYPGLKELIPQEFQRYFKPGGPPMTCNIPEFEIIPTRQFYSNLPNIEATKRNLGKTKLDKDGYIVKGSWEGGIPFPRPSGKFKAQQVFYNFFLRSHAFNMCWGIPAISIGFDRNLKIDKYSQTDVAKISWKGRTLFPPFGWMDKRAERNNEWFSYGYTMQEPRANRGTILVRMFYADPERADPSMIYIPSLRRIRKMAATDTQDPTGDMCYDDQNMILQKITPNKYPYKFEIIAEREYLLPYAYGSAPVWIDSKNDYEVRGLTFMRRPTYVLQMTQMDHNYVYGRRIYFIDKEMFSCGINDNYDQKGQLYRVQCYLPFSFVPEGGWMVQYGSSTIQRDYIDLHSTIATTPTYPAPWPRKRFNIQGIMRKAK